MNSRTGLQLSQQQLMVSRASSSPIQRASGPNTFAMTSNLARIEAQ